MAPHGTRKNTLPVIGARQGRREDSRPGKRRWHEAAPEKGHRPRAAELTTRPAVRPATARTRGGLSELRSTRRDRPGPGTHHAVPCYGCAAPHARDDHIGHLART